MKTKPCPKCSKKMIEWDYPYTVQGTVWQGGLVWRCECGAHLAITDEDRFNEAWDKANKKDKP